MARLFELGGLLDELSGRPAVEDAVRDLRTRTGDRAELIGYLAPGTDGTTLASLGTKFESLLAEDRVEDAVGVALAAVTMLRQAAPR